MICASVHDGMLNAQRRFQRATGCSVRDGMFVDRMLGA
jgi:hypothetical protein